MKNYHSDNSNPPKKIVDTNKSFIELDYDDVKEMISHWLGLEKDLFKVEWAFSGKSLKVVLHKKVN